MPLEAPVSRSLKITKSRTSPTYEKYSLMDSIGDVLFRPVTKTAGPVGRGGPFPAPLLLLFQLTLIWTPSSSAPFFSSAAFLALSSSWNSTKPMQRDSPVSRSARTLPPLAPSSAKKSRRPSPVVSRARFPHLTVGRRGGFPSSKGLTMRHEPSSTSPLSFSTAMPTSSSSPSSTCAMPRDSRVSRWTMILTSQTIRPSVLSKRSFSPSAVVAVDRLHTKALGPLTRFFRPLYGFTLST
mmetsp:Transcript_16841/g.47931  ORF Transcript_16841/g.47931 Transcript_16841/m.47931 type:complete len:239 (-) Transcript_16841:897-1613(-)